MALKILNTLFPFIVYDSKQRLLIIYKCFALFESNFSAFN